MDSEPYDGYHFNEAWEKIIDYRLEILRVDSRMDEDYAKEWRTGHPDMAKDGLYFFRMIDDKKETLSEQEWIKTYEAETGLTFDGSDILTVSVASGRHRLLAYNICSSPKYDYENTPLAEYVNAAIADNEEMSKRAGKELPLEIDYHLFDLNDDGREDYLLCMSGSLFNGNGNVVDIFIQEKEGVREVLSMPMILHNSPSDHERLTILDEKENGCYAIVPPYKDFILRYDAVRGRYGREDSQESMRDIDDKREEAGDRNADKTVALEKEQTTAEGEGVNTIRYCNYFLNDEDLARHHAILAYDICSSPRYDYENTPLAEYVEEVIVKVKKESERVGRALPLEIEYHLFDLNDDGRDDYLLCIYGTRLALDDKVAIFIQEDEGIRSVFDIDMSLHSASQEHYRLTILDEKTNGYYAIAPPYGNYILRYDVKSGRYDFGVREYVS